MGNASSSFTEQELVDYQDLTYFSRKEIILVFKRFQELDKVLLHPGFDKAQTYLPKEKLLELPELKVNPFRDRILQVFSSDGSGNMSFEDFLDMMSVFSENAPKNVKVEYAFRIYDFDGDDVLSARDLTEVINRLTGGDRDLSQKLSDEDIEQLIANIMDEADLDDDKNLSFTEFEHVMSKAPDFATSFRIRL